VHVSVMIRSRLDAIHRPDGRPKCSTYLSRAQALESIAEGHPIARAAYSERQPCAESAWNRFSVSPNAWAAHSAFSPAVESIVRRTFYSPVVSSSSDQRCAFTRCSNGFAQNSQFG